MDIHRIISMTSPPSSSPSAPPSPKLVSKTPNILSEKGEKAEEEKDKGDPKLFDPDHALKPKNIKLVKYTPAGRGSQRESLVSSQRESLVALPKTPARLPGTRQNSPKPPQTIKMTLPRTTSDGVHVQESNNKLLNLLRSKSTSGKFHNVTLNKSDMIFAPKATGSKTEFISANNTARIRSTPQKRENYHVFSSAVSVVNNGSSTTALETRDSQGSSKKERQKASFLSNVKELLQTKESEVGTKHSKLNVKSKETSPSNLNEVKKDMKGKNESVINKSGVITEVGGDELDTHEEQSKRREVNGRAQQLSDEGPDEEKVHLKNKVIDGNEKQMKTTEAGIIESSQKNSRKSVKEIEPRKKLKKRRDKEKKNTRIVASTETDDGDNKEQELPKSGQVAIPEASENGKRTKIRKQFIFDPAHEIPSQRQELPKKNTSEIRSTNIPAIIVQTMGVRPMKPEQSLKSTGKDKLQVLKSLKEKWDEALKSEEPDSLNRRKGLVKLFADISVDQDRVEDEENENSSGENVKEETRRDDNLGSSMQYEGPRAESLANARPSYDGFQPTIVMTNDWTKENVKAHEKVKFKQANSNKKPKEQLPLNPFLAKPSFAADTPKEHPAMPETSSLSKMELIYVTEEETGSSSSDEEENSNNDDISKSKPIKSDPVRFNKRRMMHPYSTSPFHFTSSQRSDMPNAPNPEAERRKFNREFPLSVVNKLQDKVRYDREIIKDLVQAGIAPHKAFNGNPNVSVTNDVCSANNYEISHAYFYQQLQRRGKLEYIPLDSTTSKEYRQASHANIKLPELLEIDHNLKLMPVMSSPEKPNTKSDVEGYSKEGWTREWRSKLKSCTIYFDTLGTFNLETPKKELVEKQLIFFKRVFAINFGSKIADALNDKVDLMIIGKTPGQIDDRIPFSQTVTNAIPGTTSNRKLRVWNHAKVWQFIKNLGIDASSFNPSLTVTESITPQVAKEEPNKDEVTQAETSKAESQKDETVENAALREDEAIGKDELRKEQAIEKDQLQKEETMKKDDLRKEDAIKKNDSQKGEKVPRVVRGKELQKDEGKQNRKRRAIDQLNPPARGKVKVPLLTNCAKHATDLHKEELSNSRVNNLNITEVESRALNGENVSGSEAGKYPSERETANESDNGSEIISGSEDDATYLEGLLKNAFILADAKDRELGAAKNIILRLSQEVMLKELKITSLEGQLKAAQNLTLRQKNTLEDYRTLLSEKDLEASTLKRQFKTRPKRKHSRDHSERH